uniref:C2 domain-containing protein n=1 Tax=Parascaris equorum TaxID=6256 RepID=A0A914RC86_PAREQ
MKTVKEKHKHCLSIAAAGCQEDTNRLILFSGSSDPYVKFKYKNRTYFKSNTIYKNLNPVWEEEFSQLIDDPTTPIVVDVYDYDRFAADDYMGGGLVDLSQLRLFQLVQLYLFYA